MKIAYTLAQVLAPSDLKGLPQGQASGDTISSVLQIVFGVAGAVTVLVIIIAALRYVTSTGNPQTTAKAKDTILYALIGLVICVLAFSIVTFVINNL